MSELGRSQLSAIVLFDVLDIYDYPQLDSLQSRIVSEFTVNLVSVSCYLCSWVSPEVSAQTCLYRCLHSCNDLLRLKLLVV